MTLSNDKLKVAAIAAAARNGKVSRREFMQLSMAAGIGLSAGASLWSSEVRAQTPQQGGTFRVGVNDGNTTDQMDPAKYQSVGEIQVVHTHRSFLTEITAENGLGPDMADSWEPNEDATVWVFKLNPNSTFHSGKKFTATDA